MRRDTYSVVYYNGGTELGKWHQTSPTFVTRQQAEYQVSELARSGYFATIWRTEDLANIGLPEGAPPNLLKWQHNQSHAKNYCSCPQDHPEVYR